MHLLSSKIYNFSTHWSFYKHILKETFLWLINLIKLNQTDYVHSIQCFRVQHITYLRTQITMYCESILIPGYQFSWIKKETQVCGFLNSWIWAFQYTHQCRPPFHWEQNFQVWPTHKNHENWYPMNFHSSSPNIIKK